MISNYPYIPRKIEGILKELFKQFPVVVVAGARQVGKSTLLENTFPLSIPRVVFDPVIDIENARSDPDLFLANRSPPLILDEIQYVPSLVSALKRKLDQDRRPGQYLITGSQQWEVMKLLSESLAGRAIILNLHPFCLAEIQKEKIWIPSWLEGKTNFKHSPPSYSLYEQLWRGFFPEAQFLKTETVSYFYQSYLSTYIEKDVRNLANISDWEQFGRFYRLCGALTAQEVNLSQFGRDIGITPQTATRWRDILKATFQWFEIPAFSQNSVKKVSLKAKGYFMDTGLVCNTLAISSSHAVANHPQWGAIFETAVVGEIRKQCSLMSPAPIMHHWRSHGGAEVDIILEWNGKFYPIEVKANSHPSKVDARGILSFRDSYPSLPIQKGLILAPSEKIYSVTPDILVMPWDIVWG